MHSTPTFNDYAFCNLTQRSELVMITDKYLYIPLPHKCLTVTVHKLQSFFLVYWRLDTMNNSKDGHLIQQVMLLLIILFGPQPQNNVHVSSENIYHYFKGIPCWWQPGRFSWWSRGINQKAWRFWQVFCCPSREDQCK